MEDVGISFILEGTIVGESVVIPPGIPTKSDDLKLIAAAGGNQGSVQRTQGRFSIAADLSPTGGSNRTINLFSFLAYSLHLTFKASLNSSAMELTPGAVLAKFTSLQMLNVHYRRRSIMISF